jgi:hypothetical protein
VIPLGIANVLSRDDKVLFTVVPPSTFGLPSREAKSIRLEGTR